MSWGLTGEVYYCFDCRKIISKESNAYHSSDHSMRKYTLTKGWYSDSPQSIRKELHSWMAGNPVSREDVARFIANKRPGIDVDEFISAAVNQGHIFESKPGFFRSVQP